MSEQNSADRPWDIQQAKSLYNIDRWGAKYFDINEAGHVIAKPLQDSGAAVDITDVIEEAKARGLKFPLLIRFQDILRHRVQSIGATSPPVAVDIASWARALGARLPVDHCDSDSGLGVSPSRSARIRSPTCAGAIAGCLSR